MTDLLALVGELLLNAQLVRMATLLLAAVGRTRRQSGVALAADLLVASNVKGKLLQSRLHHTSTQAEHQMKGALLLDVIVGQGASILKLLACKD